ncbi:hypothetical protein COY16_01305 [Candidatus Roizmanbacteria bacterium CG_4_10_14_0_2_um_filter_39_13]|uniref:Uncharacterized protein n=1 Tax=Candidatus Roizmanbacteria bacterium CG_4_10_14_0_2_um_filter_39_13 TaxID=1974825 RepID=A0A2M7U0V1_9BACT|nr:MAG: hypothetical protein COY16_01305 [Candidatus Roizmanbacteria bacterium CG_4_10_14_0_2_um_filter_39_13]
MKLNRIVQAINKKIPHISSKKNKRFFISVTIGVLGFVAIIIATASVTYYLTLRANAEVIEAFEKSGITVESLAAKVIPEEGYTLKLNWGDTGKKLVESGAIDLQKYKDNYGDEKYSELMTFITDTKNENITVNSENSYFWVNTLWAMGLVQKSDVLEKGIIGTEYKDEIGSFASTGGWTLGTTDAISLYSSTNIVDLSLEQQQRVAEIAGNIYRPCCGNSAAFPDCNHGMAILGLIELMVAQGSPDSEIYEASLAFNSYWFPQTYADLAYYFETKQDTAWEDIDPKTVLGQAYSSGQGYARIKQEIGNIPGLQSGGGSCGA